MIKIENTIKVTGVFRGSSVKENSCVSLKFGFLSTVLPAALQFVAGVGKKIKLGIFAEDSKYYLGEYWLYSFRMDRDGESVIEFRSDTDSVNLNNISMLAEIKAEIEIKAKILSD